MKYPTLRPPFYAKWQKELKSLEQQKQGRRLRLPQGLDFSSNDYLSLSQEPHIRKSLVQALKGPVNGTELPLPLSAGGSRLIRGHTPYHVELESAFQKWIGRESALFFNSGYMANIGIIPILQRDTALFSDQMNHASLIDGARLSQLTRHIYPHKDTNRLESLLKKEKSPYKAIITESLFSMGGDFAPLEELSYLSLKYQALLIVDEAHATGLYGHKGRGLTSLLKQKDHTITIHPCGKALSASGAFIAGPRVLKPYLINKCRTFIYTTAPSPIVAFHLQCVLDFLTKNPQRRERVKKKARFFRKLLSGVYNMEDSESVIVPVILGSAERALSCEEFLRKKGYDIRAMRWPTVPKGQESLRIGIHYKHTNQQLQVLAGHLNNWGLLRPNRLGAGSASGNSCGSGDVSLLQTSCET